MKIIFTLLAGVLLTGFSIAQITNNTNTVGLLYTEPDKVSEGLILFAPNNSKFAYLIDNCGFVVHKWGFETSGYQASAYLLPNGSVAKLVDEVSSELSSCIEHRNWEDELLWRYCNNEANDYDFHSDLQYLPNGNFLVLSYNPLSAEEAILAGVNPDSLRNLYYTESLIELKPIGKDKAETVWQWKMSDHLVQDYDSTKLNYGNVSENFRKIDANLSTFFHFNSVNYNAELDQIALSNYVDSEIYIIDHSTTISEAASDKGGRYDFGGDLLFRWGNPNNYGIADEQQYLLDQHNPQWVPSNNNRFGGKMSIFNNGYGSLNEELEENVSGIFVIDIDSDQDGIYPLADNGSFLPKAPHFIWTGEFKDTNIYSRYMSGVNVLPNGHLLICEASGCRFTEVDTSGNVIWAYRSPDKYGEAVPQGFNNENNEVYKIEKYSYSYIPQLNKQLCGTHIIEDRNELSDLCKPSLKPMATFTTIINNNQLSLMSETINADSLFWNFGDGNISVEINPTYSYNEIGTYNVCMEAYNCYGADTLCKEIKIDQITAINEVAAFGAVQIYPVPAIAQIHITTTNNFAFTNYLIYNLASKLIKDGNYVDHKIAVDFLADGVYLLQLTNHLNNESIIFKFIKSQ